MKLKKFLPEIIRSAKDPKLTTKDIVHLTSTTKYDKKALQCLYYIFSCAVNEFKTRGRVNLYEIFPDNEAYRQMFYYLFKEDQSTYMFILSLIQHELKGKTYTLSPDFYRVFKNVDIGVVQTRHLPDASGFISLPEPLVDGDNDRIHSFFFHVGEIREYLRLYTKDQWDTYNETQQNKLIPSQKCVSCTWLDQKGSTGYFFHPLPKDETIPLKETFKNTKFQIRTITAQADLEVDTYHADGFLPYIATMLNTLAYLKSGNPDLREFYNTIKYRSPDSKTPLRSDKNLATDPITLVGFGWQKQPLWHKSSWESSPYWAERRCGPGRTKSKIVFCQGSLKKRRAVSLA